MTRPYTLLHFLLVFCFIFTAISSWAQWTQVDTGLNGGQVGTLLVKDGYIFSGGTGVFRSADNGVTWEKKITGLTSIHVYVLAERNGKIYAGTNAGIFISSDNGDTWNQANPSLAQAFAIAFNGDVMFVGSQSGVHVSSDEGLTWELRSEGLNGYFVNALATKDGKVIAGTTGGVLISDDDGESWVASSVTSNVLALEVHNGHLFASVFPMAFYRSADDGENWTNISSTLGLAPFVNHIASSGTRLFISHNTDVKYSDDNGDTWTSTTEFTPYNVDAIVFDGANNIFAASYFHVYKSSNNGATWNTADNGRGLVSISDFLITGSTFIATSVGNGVFVSNDQGLTWESRNNGLIEKVVTSITEHEGILYVGTENAVFHSTDNALTWNRWAIGNSYVQQVAVHGDKILAATTSGVYILESGVWSSSNTGFTDLDVNDIVSVDEKVFAATQNGIYLSTDDGTTWSATAATLPFASANILQYIDESLWAATNTGVYYSKDDGVTWTKTGPDNPYVYSIERVGDLIFLGTTYGSIYVTRLNSTQYHSIDLDLTSLSIQAFIVNNNKVWMGTSAGLWSATVSEFTPPAITSFTPSFGRLGETVTITGADFDPVAANNIVRFGGVEAKIVSANASSITVIVPKEARAGQVTVTKNGLTATSASDFYVMAVADEWIDRNNGIAGGLIMSMTSKDNQLFAASFDNGVYTSSDNGETWTSINQGLGHLQAFSVSPVGDALYAGTLSGVYVSTDNGASWSFKGLSSNGITSVVSIGSTLLASSYNAGVFASTDHGVSWQPANTGMTSYDVRKLLVFDGRVFAATGDGVFSSGNEGQSWVGHTPGRFIYNLMANDGVLYASAAGGIFISTDGSNWESLSSQLTAPITNTLVSNGTIIATDITGGIYRSSDSGLTWEPVVSKVSVGYSLLLASEKFLLGTVDQGIFESVDNGVTWVPVAVGPKASVTTILPDPINIFVGTHATVFTSGTSGQNWSRGGDGLKGRHVLSITRGANRLFAGTDSGVYASDDEGSTWSSVGLPGEFIGAVSANEDMIFAVTSAGSLYAAENGNSWTVLNTSMAPDGVLSVKCYEGKVYAATANGVFISPDNGTNWEPTTLTSATKTLAIDGANIFALDVFGNKITRSGDGGETWDQLPLEFGANEIVALAAEGPALVASGNGVFVSNDYGATFTQASIVSAQNNQWRFWVNTVEIINDEIFAGTQSYGLWSRPLDGFRMQQTISFDELPSKTFGDAQFAITATSSSELPVSFRSSDPLVANVLGNNIVIVKAGTVTITAYQDGDDFYAPTAVERTLVVNKANQVIQVSTIDDKTFGDQPFAINASSSSNLPVVITSSNPSKATVNGNTVTLLAPGSVTFTMTQPGDNNYIAASAVAKTICVRPSQPSISMIPEGSQLTSSAAVGNQWFFNNAEINEATSSTLVPDKTGSYSVQATVDGCQSVMSAPVNVVITGVEESGAEISVYPTLVKDILTVKSPLVKPYELTVFDALGRSREVSKQTHANTTLLDVTPLHHGIYFLTIRDQHKSYTYRFVKE